MKIARRVTWPACRSFPTRSPRALVVYHLAEKRPMMGAFLDALGIAHENGLIQQDNVAPDPAKIDAAAEALTSQFPLADVSLYLNTLLCQDPQTWGALAPVVKRLEST
jgi:hypothetical protein